jgi:acyl-CoA synthetase (AMP-forming)/AMP-acid ligase II
LIGRVDDLINFGGEKVDPVKLEEPMRGMDSVKDVCVTSVEELDGKE